MGFNVNVSISALTVFAQGLLSFFSPCVLPLLPLYIGYLSGGTGSRGEDGLVRYDQKKVMLHTLFFVLGSALPLCCWGWESLPWAPFSGKISSGLPGSAGCW